MDNKMKNQISFDKQASFYDTSIYSRIPRMCYPHVMDALKNIEFNNILDLGCGTGTILNMISKELDVKELYGLDLSKKMLEIAKDKLGAKAELTVGDAENLPYVDDFFEAIVCVESFHHYPNPKQALYEINRVLKPGGTLILCDAWIFSPMRELFNLFIKYGSNGDVRIYSEKEIVELLESANFMNIEWKAVIKRAYICLCKK
ncbi:MAG: class I SAM-dependent methyltransferase [Clostridioides difficile]|nr:methyltransferase domain-containing protein [Clostridioides sp.]MBS5787303.1 class I SAM-dependent methyltransferase [Clostridioides difficile]